MIQSVTFIIIRPQAPICFPPFFRLFSLRLICLLLAESSQKIFLTFVYSCSVSHTMEFDSGILSRMIIFESPSLRHAFYVCLLSFKWKLIGFTGGEKCHKCLFLQFWQGARCRLATSSVFCLSGCSFFMLQSSTISTSFHLVCNQEKWGFLCFLWSSSTMIKSNSRQVKTVCFQQTVCELLKYVYKPSMFWSRSRSVGTSRSGAVPSVLYDASFRNQNWKKKTQKQHRSFFF